MTIYCYSCETLLNLFKASILAYLPEIRDDTGFNISPISKSWRALIIVGLVGFKSKRDQQVFTSHYHSGYIESSSGMVRGDIESDI